MSALDFAKDLLYDLEYAQDESVPELEDPNIDEFATLHGLFCLLIVEEGHWIRLRGVV